MKLINLPNIFTCGNILCGSMAVFCGITGDIGLACLFIIGGVFFDFFDGMIARALHISGPIGKELDSLADMVSFGLAPSVLAYQITRTVAGPEPNLVDFFLAMIMTAFSGLRLAKFNCDERQSLSFIGLPTPSNALFWIGLSYLVRIESVHQFLMGMNLEVFFSLWFLLVLLMSYLLICELPMFSFKFKPGHNSFAENKLRYTFMAFCIITLIATAIYDPIWFCASPAIGIAVYLILCLIEYLTSTKE